MKKTMQKSLAVLLAVVMTFGAIPFVSVGLLAFAADRVETMTGISINFDTTPMEEGTSRIISVSGAYSDAPYSASIPLSDVWISSENSEYVQVENGSVLAMKPTEPGKPVTIHAQYKYKPSMVADVAVTVIKAPKPVERIEWDWDTNAFLADTGKVYSFAYVDGSSSNVYRVFPSNADVKTATLSCYPADALEIDNEAKTFTVSKLPAGRESMNVSLILKADGASKTCKEATKSVTVYNDVPISGIRWLFPVGNTGKTLFKFYDNDGKVAKYYYKPTDMGNPKAPYKFETIPANENFLELCDITVTSSDKRVISFYEPTGQIVPLGNGESTLTVKIVTPKGRTFSDTVIGVVQGSPYTAVTSVAIGYDEKNTDSGVEYDSGSNTVTLNYTKKITLEPHFNSGVSADLKTLTVYLDDGSKKPAKAPEITWDSSSDPKPSFIFTKMKSSISEMPVTISGLSSGT